MSGIVADQTLSILIDPGATKSFISSAMLKIIKAKEVKQDKFIFVEMASGAKQKVGGVPGRWDINFYFRYQKY
jgi:hypothetical protein